MMMMTLWMMYEGWHAAEVDLASIDESAKEYSKLMLVRPIIQID